MFAVTQAWLLALWVLVEWTQVQQPEDSQASGASQLLSLSVCKPHSGLSCVHLRIYMEEK